MVVEQEGQDLGHGELSEPLCAWPHGGGVLSRRGEGSLTAAQKAEPAPEQCGL